MQKEEEFEDHMDIEDGGIDDKDDTNSNITADADFSTNSFSTEELATVTSSTNATVHVVHNKENTQQEPSSTKDETIKEVESTVTFEPVKSFLLTADWKTMAHFYVIL